jgi:hypothetical protein
MASKKANTACCSMLRVSITGVFLAQAGGKQFVAGAEPADMNKAVALKSLFCSSHDARVSSQKDCNDLDVAGDTNPNSDKPERLEQGRNSRRIHKQHTPHYL